MKTLICVTICLFSLCQAYPAGEVSTQDQAPGNANNVQDECSVGNWKERLQSNKQQILSVIKAHMSKTHAERWYSIPSADRQCLTTAQQYVGFLWIAGVVNTEDECMTKVKQTCPNVSAEIDAWHNESVAHRKNASDSWNASYSNLPQSVKDVLTNLNETFNSLRRSGVFIKQNKTAIQAALLPVVQEFRTITPDEWDEVVDEFPKTELILGSNGNLTKPFFVLVEALEDYLSNVAVNQTAVKEAQQAFAQYAQEKCRQYVPALQKYVKSLPKSELSPQAQSEIDSSVDNTIAAATDNASSS